MLNLSSPTCTKVELWDLTVCIVVNGENRLKSCSELDLDLIMPNLSELYSYTTMYLNFMFLDLFLFWVIMKQHRNIHTHTHRDCDKYSIVCVLQKCNYKYCHAWKALGNL